LRLPPKVFDKAVDLREKPAPILELDLAGVFSLAEGTPELGLFDPPLADSEFVTANED